MDKAEAKERETGDDRILRLRRKARALPLLPGVYFMKNAAGKIIYIGKAKALRNRVSSYFTGIERHLPKVASMVRQVQDFETIVTANELEALVLECSQIK
ncbi:MAG: GIY-YIG nuclease family protein, partial [Clostridia bacterium]|nr:GIY-YIG nuclease family protein [Clostridia bacterium]